MSRPFASNVPPVHHPRRPTMTFLRPLKRSALAAFLTAAAAFGMAPAPAPGVIKIGEVNSYKAHTAVPEPCKTGRERALAHATAARSVSGSTGFVSKPSNPASAI